MNGFITDTIWAWFWGWHPLAHLALAVGVGLFLWGTLAALYNLASKLGGWRAGVGALIALGAVLASLWPRKGVTTEEQYGAPPAPAPKKKRTTIFDRKKRPF
jgi:hypothetical protein